MNWIEQINGLNTNQAVYKKRTELTGDSRVAEKEREKVEKYQDLKREVARIWSMRKVEVIPVVVGALGMITKNLDKWIEKIGIKINAEHIQKTAIFWTARILRKVLEA